MNQPRITWSQLRRRPAAQLAVGDVWIVLKPFTTYHLANDGITVCGAGWEEPEGTVWTLISVDGGKVTARSRDGVELVDEFPARTHVLRVEHAA